MTSAAPAVTTRTFSFDSQLIEDFLQTEEMLVDTTCPQPTAVFLNNQGESEALVISQNAQGIDELFHVCREPLSDSGWNLYGMGAKPLAIAVADSNTVWAVGTDLQIWRNNTGLWSQRVPALPGGATLAPFSEGSLYSPISAGTDGSVWVIDSQGNLYQLTGDDGQGAGTWQPVAGAPALATAPVGSVGSLWAISSGFQVLMYSNGSWQPTSWPSYFPPYQISVGEDGSVWALDNHANLYQFENQQWQQSSVANSAMFFAVVSSNAIWGINFHDTWSVVFFNGASWVSCAQGPELGTGFLDTPQISASADGTVWCVGVDGVSWKLVAGSQTWQRQMMPTGMSGGTAAVSVSEIAVGVSNGKTLAFSIAEGDLSFSALTQAGTWRTCAQSFSGCSGLGLTNQQDTQELIAYCVDSDGNMIVITDINSESGSSNIVTINASKTLKGAKLFVNAMAADAWFTASVSGGYLCIQFGGATNPLGWGPEPVCMYAVTQQPDGSSAPTNLVSLVPLPWMETSAGFYCAAVDANGNLFMVYNISINVTNNGVGCFVPLTGSQAPIPSPLAAVKSTGALIDASNWTRIYATDANDNLWVIRQTADGGDVNNPWTWTAWHPLGNSCLSIANGPGTCSTRELFTLDGDGFLNHLWQDSVSLNWNEIQLRKPNGVQDDPNYVSQYVTEVTVYDASGNPESGVPVTVSVAEGVAVWESGVQYNLDPAHPVTLVTNLSGKLTLSTVAMGLHTAQLTFQADGFANPYTVYPPQNAQNRLSNVDESTLQNAQARTQSVPTAVSTPLVSATQQSNCGTAATLIQGVFTIKTNNNIQPGMVTGVGLDRSDPRYEAVRALWKGKVIDVRRRAIPGSATPPELGSWDSFWNDLANFGEDIWHGIRKGILVVEDIAVDTVAGAINLTLSIGAGIESTIQFFVKTIDDVVHAIGSAFRWLGAKIEAAVDWLKEFFSWDDILNTKTVMEYYLNQVYTNLIQSVDPNSPNNIQQLMQVQFQKLVSMIVGNPDQPGSDIFSQSQGTFGTSSFNGTASQAAVDPRIGSNPLQPDVASETYRANQVKSNYARTRTETYIHRGGKISPPAAGATLSLTTGSFENLLNLITSSLDLNNPQSPYNIAKANFQQNLQGLSQPKDLFDTAISDFLNLVKDLAIIVVEVVEAIALAVLDMAGECLAALQGILNYPIQIPVISWLYQKISGHPLTLMDVLCLVMAIPATLLYKLIWGGSDASPPFKADQVASILSQPIPWPQIQGANVAMALHRWAPLGDDQSINLPAILGLFSVINGLAYAFIDIATDADAMVPGQDGLPTWFSVLSMCLSFASLGFGVPYQVMETALETRSAGDICTLVLWALGLLAALVNVVWFFASKTDTIAKYQAVFGPIIVCIFGTLQLAAGVVAAIEFSKPGSGYNAAYTVGGIVTPIPSVAKLLLLTENENAMWVLGPLDLICDFASGLCTFVENIT